jgi:hypothetical protein
MVSDLLLGGDLRYHITQDIKFYSILIYSILFYFLIGR